MAISYDFSVADAYIHTDYTPEMLSSMLSKAALKLAVLDNQGTSVIEDMQLSALEVCRFLETIRPQ